jgi:hypothetical protein
MKVVFLDVDGVLNTNLQRKEWGMDFISPRKIDMVARICKHTGAKIVVSSMWGKNPRDLQLVKNALDKAGIIDRFIGCTPDFFNDDFDDVVVELVRDNDRKAEINQWLSRMSGVTNFAILDDLKLPMENLFLCDDDGEGLTDEIADLVIQHLNR